jgi:hypothetical protein
MPKIRSRHDNPLNDHGDDMQGLTIHKALLASRSGLFRDTLDSVRSGARDSGLTVEGDDVDVMDLYVQFLYTGRLPIRSPTVAATDEYVTLCKLYTLATKLRDLIAKNAALDTIYNIVKEDGEALPSSDHVGMIYSGTPGPRCGRRMLVDLYMQKASGQEMIGHVFPAEFMNELATSMAVHRAIPTGIPWVIGRTAEAYHDE